MRTDDNRLLDILDAAADIRKFLGSNPSEDIFGEDHLLRSAVLLQLLIIGEAAARISKELRERNINVNWDDLRYFRNFIVHEYFLVDWSIVWETATFEIPELVPEIVEVIKKEFPYLITSGAIGDEIL
ncbi:MAG TPA: HepT-like ribonuclease domain-containing protein [Candidatus Kapabacteria bacterium]|jgi:uncharacterized protein with HEPN domain|nr:HepT-like ribonuclease domain-containing protein [Candidatus Kapabacteria bacterium]